MVGKLNRGGSLDKMSVNPGSRDWRFYAEGFKAQVKQLPSASNPYTQMPASGRWDQGWADANAQIANKMMAEKPGAVIP